MVSRTIRSIAVVEKGILKTRAGLGLRRIIELVRKISCYTLPFKLSKYYYGSA